MTEGQRASGHRVGPRYSVERELRNIWADLLGHRDFGVHDNFFDVGGDSVIAIRMLARIKQSFGFDLSLENLFRAPTIGGIGMFMRGDAVGSGAVLVPLRPHGTRRPLFCFHPIGGSVARYFTLAAALDDRHPVYALQSVGLTDAAKAQDDVSEMARHYLAEMRKAQPSGPYQLIGYSMGGILAYEVAQQAKAFDGTDSLVLLVDTSADAASNGNEGTALQAVANYAMKLDVDTDRLASLPLAEALARVRIAGIESGVLDWDFPLDWLHTVYRTVDGNLRALAAYHPLPYSGPTVLFHGGSPQGSDDDDLGWRPLACRLTTYHLGLGHFVLMEDRGTKRIAALLQALLSTEDTVAQHAAVDLAVGVQRHGGDGG